MRGDQLGSWSVGERVVDQADTHAVDLTVPSAEWKPENTDLATSCGDHNLALRRIRLGGTGRVVTFDPSSRGF